MQHKKLFSGECVKRLTDTHSKRIMDLFMAKLKQIVAGLTRQMSRKLDDLSKANKELAKLAEAYQRYRDISERIAPISESAKISLALVMNLPRIVAIEGDAYDPKNREECERAMQDSDTIPFSPSDMELESYPLWKIIREILRQVPEMRVYELEAHLKNFGVVTIRSAIESALATHTEQFKITKRGREKFVALKGA